MSVKFTNADFCVCGSAYERVLAIESVFYSIFDGGSFRKEREIRHGHKSLQMRNWNKTKPLMVRISKVASQLRLNKMLVHMLLKLLDFFSRR